MALHRSEAMKRNDGSIVQVDFIALFVHMGPMREMVLNLKYQGIQRIAKDMGELMSPKISACQGIDVITWAPTSQLHHKERGFDQSELIARHCSAITQISHRKLLRRLNTEHQTGKGRQERLDQPRFIGRPVKNKSVCVVDDVMTTGATLTAAAEALIMCGASNVRCISFSYVE